MKIEFAILGLLSWKPLSGYDLKARFENSSLLYWSGNNNQIYTALVELHKAGLVSQQVQLQESLPAKKIYSITEKGRVTLREWALTTPELEETRHPFLIQLSWTDQLSTDELDGLLQRYETEVTEQLLVEEEQIRRATIPGRNSREAFLWEKINENLLERWQRELAWVRCLRKELREKDGRP